MIKVTPSDFRHQTSDFIIVKDFVQDSSLDVEPVRRSTINTLPRSEVFERIFSQDFYLKILFPSNIRLNSDD